MKLARRIAILLVLLIAGFYVLALGYLRVAEPSQAFIGADLDGEERLNITGHESVPWDTVRVTSDDSVRILLLESRLAEKLEAPWVIYFYGRAGRLADNKGFAMYHLFREVGLNVLSLDYRGYGASQKTQPTEAGFYADARAAWQYLTDSQGVPANRVILYGYSLGGAVAIQLATETSPAGLITESAFSSGPAWVNFHYPWIPETLARLAIRNRFETFQKASSLPLPWLLFHGRQDAITPFSHAEVLAGTNAGPRRLVPFESGHEDVIDVGRDQMKSALTDFLRDLFGLDRVA